ncbi:MAG: HEAT repeat domain-containing protein [Bacteroidales bacterium]
MKNRFKIFTLLILTSFICSTNLNSKSKRGNPSIAIVVDSEVLEKCKNSIDSYAASIEADGLKAIVVEERWGVPDSIRGELKRLYSSKNLEGAVFIGEIPIPMIRNGQHLTTAFKMNQNRAWEQSSVPSDRFYDDFHLQFDYLKQDSIQPLYHYYNLSPQGPQKVESAIYSARIRPPHYPGKDRFQMIDSFLRKAVAEKSRARTISKLLYFGGNGYNSNSLISRADERIALTEMFSTLSKGRGSLIYIDHTFDDFVKDRLIGQLTQPDLDLAILHHHGSDDAQLLNGSPYTNMASNWIAMAQKFFRGKIRRSKDTTESKNYYIKNYNVPSSWVERSFDPEVVKQDSLYDASLDISIEDLREFKPTAPFVVLDACFTGSFHLEDYLAGHYPFNNGTTVVVRANSVNTLQDVWTIQLMGLLDLGVSVGNWAREQFTLESHLIGDPTYRYASSQKEYEGLNWAITHRSSDTKYWKKLSNSSNPEVKALAIRKLYGASALTEEQLLTIQSSDPSPSVRMMAFNLINSNYNSVVAASLEAGLSDNYELLQRFAAKLAQTNQSPQLLPLLAKLQVDPGTSKRVLFQVNGALGLYPKEAALAAYDNAVEGKEGEWWNKKRKERDRLVRSLEGAESDFNQLLDSTFPANRKRQNLSSLRNLNTVSYLPTLFQFMRESNDTQLKLVLAEAFGWFTNSWRLPEIVEFCRQEANRQEDPQVKRELLRSVNRLTN